MDTITVCMGSSCFSRGNSTNAGLIQEIIEQKKLSDTVLIKGCLCEEACKKGPNIKINDKMFSHVTPELLPDLLSRELGISV